MLTIYKNIPNFLSRFRLVVVPFLVIIAWLNRPKLFLALLAVFLIVHQLLYRNDGWFNFQQLWCHETLIACFIFAAIALVAGKYLGRC